MHDIAWQMVNAAPGNKAKVVMGGGYPAFFPESIKEDMRRQVRASSHGHLIACLPILNT